MCKHLLTCHEAGWFTGCDHEKIDIGGAEAKTAYVSWKNTPQAKLPSKDSFTSQLKYTPEAFVDALIELVAGDDLVCFYFILLIYIFKLVFSQSILWNLLDYERFF